MSKFEKGKAFAKKQAAQFGVERTRQTLESIIGANPGRPANDPYVKGLWAGLEEMS